MSRSFLLSFAGALLLSACGVETSEDAAAWDAVEALERQAALVCANVPSSYTATAGDPTCESFGTYVQVEDDGGCPAGYTPGTATTGALCDIAKGLLEEPGDCPSGCQDGGVSGATTSGSSSSCTASQYRECSAFAETREFESQLLEM